MTFIKSIILVNRGDVLLYEYINLIPGKTYDLTITVKSGDDSTDSTLPFTTSMYIPLTIKQTHPNPTIIVIYTERIFLLYYLSCYESVLCFKDTGKRTMGIYGCLVRQNAYNVFFKFYPNPSYSDDRQ